MMDPYSILGVNRTASDDEVKKAYRNLSRKYHPDANVNNPNKEAAEEKFKQVQQAYDQIMRERQQGSSYDRGFYGSTQSDAQDEASKMLNVAANFIRNRAYDQALNVLNRMPENDRKGRWYYLSAVANSGMGNTAVAQVQIQRAVTFEPSNMEYRQFQQFLNGGGTWYSGMGNTYERPYFGVGRFCFSLALMELFCSCCCRPF